MKDFVLPKYWYIEVNDENRDLLIKWRKDRLMICDDISGYKFINSSGAGVVGMLVFVGWLITTEQFKSHVLKLDITIEKEIIENFDYLIKLFKKLNIQ